MSGVTANLQAPGGVWPPTCSWQLMPETALSLLAGSCPVRPLTYGHLFILLAVAVIFQQFSARVLRKMY